MIIGTLGTPMPAKQLAPAFFIKFMMDFLGSDKKTAVAVWSRLYPSADLLYQLVRVDNLKKGSVEKFGELVTPKSLLAACERVAKDKGRSKALIELEERLLQMTGPDGAWR